MRVPTTEDPNPRRKPDNWEEEFEDGDFADFIKPIVDTLDLYHNQGVDPRAIAISFKELAENNPQAGLRVVAMEARGEDKFLLRAKTTPDANHSQLSAQYFNTYNQFKGLPESEIRTLLREKDIRLEERERVIRKLESMVETALEHPSFYARTYHHEGDVMPDQSSETTNIKQRGSFGIGVSQGEVKAEKIAGTIHEAQSKSMAEAAAEIQQLLDQLSQTYPTSTTAEQMVVAAEAIKRIESDPTLKQRVINAAKEGGLAAFEKALDNPIGALITGAIKGWVG